VSGATGRRFIWTHHGEEGPIGYLVTLNPRQEPNRTVLALNTYCRPFPVGSSRLGIWCPESPAVQLGNPYIRVLCFDPEQLEPFHLEDVAGWFKQSNERIYSATAPLAEFEISSALAGGTHPIAVPAEFHEVEEVLMISSYPTSAKNDPACAIFIVYPHSGLVEVLPQKWYTANQFGIGYQWITRVARDPVTQRLIGGGIRMKNFELTEDGRDLARWIE
jgi:hypothetical protein